MRSEREMLKLVLDVAAGDERVRAVAMDGSRADPAAPPDCFQDYDIAFLVTEMDSFTADDAWLDVFGERIILQKPEAMDLFPPDLGGWFSWLMLFCDGTRIDLIALPAAEAEAFLRQEPYIVPLLDKDGLLAGYAPPEASPYNVKKPSAQAYADCCNEFFWVSTYVAKGLWRAQPLYAAGHLEGYVRPMLLKMLEWQVGAAHDFGVATGKLGKYLYDYLPEGQRAALMGTYLCDTPEATWVSLFGCASLFRAAARRVGDALGYAYPQEEDDRVSAYLRAVRAAPPGTPPDFSAPCK